LNRFAELFLGCVAGEPIGIIFPSQGGLALWFILRALLSFLMPLREQKDGQGRPLAAESGVASYT
jgi:hypothetical protein